MTTPQAGKSLLACGRFLHGVACPCVDALRLRRAQWVARPWKRTQKGNWCLEVDGGRVTVFVYKGDYRFLVRNAVVNAFSLASFASIDQAKLGAFDWLHGGGGR